MQVIRGISQLADYLNNNGCEPGCLSDTGFLYALSDTDDRLYKEALNVFDLFEEFNVRIYANVISRMEFIDLLFRKQITIGAVETFKKLNVGTTPKGLFNLLKSIRDENTALLNDNQSYKVPEGKLKKLREQLELYAGPTEWKEFSRRFTGEMLFNEWKIFEQELGLNLVEVLEGGTSDIIAQPLHWSDMVQVMGKEGIRGPDAMIANLFLKSCLPLLITTDNDIVRSFDDDDPEHASKTIFHLEQ